MVGKTRSPHPNSLVPTIVQNTPSSPEIAPAHYLGRSKVTLLSPTLSTQTQAEKPIGKGRTVTPPHISDKCVRKTWFHSPPNSPPFIPRGPMAPPTAPISQPPSSLMPETLSICCRALGCVPLTPCCWCYLDDGRVNRTGAYSPPPLFTAPERLQLQIRPVSWRCFPVAIDRRDIVVSLPPVATATAPASPTRQLDLPTSPCRQIGRTLISNHFI